MRFLASRSARLIAATVATVAAIAGLDMALPPPLHTAADVSRVVLDRNAHWIHAFTNSDKRWRFQADLDKIDPVFIERLIAVEDKRFWRHPGVDLLAVIRAGNSAFQAGRIVSGASTVTMQTARLLEPRPRNIWSKLAEMARAFQLERRLSKREILELYLTLAPYGGNIEGVRGASLLYFNKEPLRLTDAEQALLIALPQAPEARRPDLRPEAALNARKQVLAELRIRNLIAPELEAEAADSSLPIRRAAMPRAAYHAANAIIDSAKTDDATDERSTIDLRLQLQAEALTRAHAAKSTDGATAALLIVDNRTRSVRSLVGSSGLDAPGGWIDLTAALRSPGSTLKPFIYGLAFDEGLAGPDTLIDDTPHSFGGYSPENFDRIFRGEVRVFEALQHSLNLPAVTLLDKIGADKLAATLKASGVAIAGPKSADPKFGLTLALGGAGISLRDLAALYAGLANSGSVTPLVWTAAVEEAGEESPSYQLFSEQSAHRVSEILAGAPALEGRMPSDLTRDAPVVAYKTGTSYGYRDAWAAGYAGAYTVVVWVGRADGAARPGVTGRKTAAPLLLDVFDLLARHDPGAMPKAPLISEAPIALARLGKAKSQSPPEIVFPRNGIELFIEDRGIALSARGGSGSYRWYVSGDLVKPERPDGRVLWTPATPGFYEVTVVDASGRSSRSRIRVHATPISG